MFGSAASAAKGIAHLRDISARDVTFFCPFLREFLISSPAAFAPTSHIISHSSRLIPARIMLYILSSANWKTRGSFFSAGITFLHLRCAFG